MVLNVPIRAVGRGGGGALSVLTAPYLPAHQMVGGASTDLGLVQLLSAMLSSFQRTHFPLFVKFVPK